MSDPARWHALLLKFCGQLTPRNEMARGSSGVVGIGGYEAGDRERRPIGYGGFKPKIRRDG